MCNFQLEETFAPSGSNIFSSPSSFLFYLPCQVANKNIFSYCTEPKWSSSIQFAQLLEEIRKEKFPNKTIWAWTGFLFDRDLKEKEVLKYIDTLVDGQFQEKLKNPKLKWCGSENQRVINVQESLKNNKIVLVD